MFGLDVSKVDFETDVVLFEGFELCSCFGFFLGLLLPLGYYILRSEFRELRFFHFLSELVAELSRLLLMLLDLLLQNITPNLNLVKF